METAFAPAPRSDDPGFNCHSRAARRALVFAPAIMSSNGRPSTEHMTYDLSTGGVHLCGLPRAREGDRVRVLLQLPRARFRASGHLLRMGWTAGRPDFAVEFLNLSPQAEDAIQDAVLEALSAPPRPSVLVIDDPERTVAADGWLDPISPICVAAHCQEALQHLMQHPIDVGILSMPVGRLLGPTWAELEPGILWRTINEAGCLYRVDVAGTRLAA